jgi:Protein of unknown function (DUF1761)/Domain of unknown function (DUF6265)
MPAHYLNIPAVFTAAASGFLIAGLWYSPLLFGRAWQTATGLTAADLAKQNKGRVFGLAFVLMLMMSFNLAMFLDQPTTTLTWGATAGFLAGFGWVALEIGVVSLFESKPFSYVAVNGGYMVVTFVVMGAILGGWRTSSVPASVGVTLFAAEVPAPATTKDLAWLEGTWEGKVASGPAGGHAEVTFQKPVAGLVSGVMRLVDQDKILVIELISVFDGPQGMELRFRHFSTALEAYEPTFKQAMRLTSAEGGTFTFENSVPYDKALSSTQPRVTKFIRKSKDEFVGHSDIIGDDGKSGTVEVVYRRTG